MNGVHDMGGAHGFGPVRTDDQAAFHARWEMRVYAIMGTMQRRGVFNTDEMRRAIESLPPAQYLSSTYFQRWLGALRMLLIEKGVCAPAEIEAAERRAQTPGQPAQPRRDDPALTKTLVDGLRPASMGVPASADLAAPRFKVGDPVRAKNKHVRGHTRLPRYVRGKKGAIYRVHGIQTFPDTNARAQGTNPQPVYSVGFSARELWGEDASPAHAVYIDLWESYLDPA